MQYNRKYQKIQGDYHNLISIAADLIDALEQAVQGQPVSSLTYSVLLAQSHSFSPINSVPITQSY